MAVASNGNRCILSSQYRLNNACSALEGFDGLWVSDWQALNKHSRIAIKRFLVMMKKDK
jgi:hypothetical protein